MSVFLWFIKRLALLLGVLAISLALLVVFYLVWTEIYGWITCDSQTEPYSETGVPGVLCFEKIKRGAERGEPHYVAVYTDILMGDGKYEVAKPFVKKCVLEGKSCVHLALDLCQKSVPGFDVNFIEQGFAIADRRTTGTADYADSYERAYRAGAYAPCVPTNFSALPKKKNQ